MATLYRYRILKREMGNENELNPKILTGARKFRKQMSKFKLTTKLIRSVHSGENIQIGLLSREIDDLQRKIGLIEEDFKQQ